jgi:putative chitinase
VGQLKQRTAADWQALLQAIGTRSNTALKWAPIFAAVMMPTAFSAGEADLVEFLPTVYIESARFERLMEGGSYSPARIRELGNASKPGTRWRSLVPLADQIAYNEEAFFEACYGGRMGNDQPGDGAKYRGRGLIMLTGKNNYAWQSARSGLDLVAKPELAEQPDIALKLAVDFYEGRVPDTMLGDVLAVRRQINGGAFGLPEVTAARTALIKALQ